MSPWLLSMVLNCHRCLDNLILCPQRYRDFCPISLRFPDIVKQMRKGEVSTGNGLTRCTPDTISQTWPLQIAHRREIYFFIHVK